MIRCHDCGTDNRDGSRFCGNCGRELREMPDAICPKCGTPNSAQNVLCSDCLSPLHPPSQEAEIAVTEEPVEAPAEEALASRDDAAAQDGAESEIDELPADEETLDQLDESASSLSVGEDFSPPREVGQQMPEESSAVVPSLDLEGEPWEPLENIVDVLPLENIMALPHRSESPLPRTVPPEHDDQAKLLRQVLVSPRLGEETRRLVSGDPAPGPGKVIRVVLYALLALAVAIPLITDNHWFSTSMSPRDSVEGLFQAIDSLPAGSVVLLSFDYDPGTADELAPGVAVVLDHLLQREVSILALSTTPAGVPLAWQQLEQAALRAGGISYGEDYLLLGYLPGEESGLRRITGGLDMTFPRDYVELKESNQFALIQRASKLSDIALVVTMAGDRLHVQRWLEQVQAPYGVPLAAVMTAAAEPGLSPYFSSGQLRGMVGGLPGAAEYEVLRERHGPASSSADAQALAYLVIIVAALLGNIVHFLGGHTSKNARAHTRARARAETALPDSGE